jgi:hypothetical protein
MKTPRRTRTRLAVSELLVLAVVATGLKLFAADLPAANAVTPARESAAASAGFAATMARVTDPQRIAEVVLRQLPLGMQLVNENGILIFRSQGKLSGGVPVVGGDGGRGNGSVTREELEAGSVFVTYMDAVRIHASLLAQLDLPPKQMEDLLPLLVERRKARNAVKAQDVMRKLISIPADPAHHESGSRMASIDLHDHSDWPEKLRAATAPVDTKIKALLTEKPFSLFLAFEQTVPVREIFQPVWKSKPLTEEQLSRFFASLLAANPNIESDVYNRGIVIDPVIEDAKAYLDATQLSDLTDYLFILRSVGVQTAALIEAKKRPIRKM